MRIAILLATLFLTCNPLGLSMSTTEPKPKAASGQTGCIWPDNVPPCPPGVADCCKWLDRQLAYWDSLRTARE